MRRAAEWRSPLGCARFRSVPLPRIRCISPQPPTRHSSGNDDTSEPAPPSVPIGTGASSAPPGSGATPPPKPLPLPTLAPRRTPTPTPTPLPSWLVLHAAPHAPPPQHSPARRQASCPLLWCLLVGASALACLPTDAWHRTQDARKAPVRHPGPTTSSAMVALLIILGAGATPRAMSAPGSTHVAALDWATRHSPNACPTHAALSTPAGPRARFARCETNEASTDSGSPTPHAQTRPSSPGSRAPPGP